MSIFSPIIERPIQLTRDRLEGMVLGIAVGDALGLPIETWSAEKIAAQFGTVRTYLSPKFNPFFAEFGELELGLSSDDEQLTTALLDALADAGEYSLKSVIDAHIAAFHESRLGWGGSTIAGVEALIEGLTPRSPEFAAKLKSGTANGIPMKIAAVAVQLALTGGNEAEMIRMVSDLCSLSHPNSMSASAGLAHTSALLYCLSCDASSFDGEKFTAIITRASELGRDLFPDTRTSDDITNRIAQAPEFKDRTAADICTAFGGGSCYVYDSLPFSYAFFLRDPLRFEATIDAINAGGDTDSNGALVAGLQGALLGNAIIPPELSRGLKRRDAINGVCERLVERFQIS